MQQTMGPLPTSDVSNYSKVLEVVPQTLSSEAFYRRLWEIEFGPDYHPCLTGQLWVTCMHWLRPAVPTAEPDHTFPYTLSSTTKHDMKISVKCFSSSLAAGSGVFPFKLSTFSVGCTFSCWQLLHVLFKVVQGFAWA